MADKGTDVHIGENSQEHVAHKITDTILQTIEGKQLDSLDRKTYLDCYAEVLNAVKGNRDYTSLKT